MLHSIPAQIAPKSIRFPKKDKEILQVMVEGLGIFVRSQAFLTDKGWEKLNDLLIEEDPDCCVWNQIIDFYETLSVVAEKCGVINE